MQKHSWQLLTLQQANELAIDKGGLPFTPLV